MEAHGTRYKKYKIIVKIRFPWGDIMNITKISRRRALAGLVGATVFTPLIARSRVAFAQAAGTKADTPPPLTAYSKLPAVSDVAISPDGARLAFLSSKNDERLVVDYEVATKKMSAAAISGVKYRDVMWADNSHVLIETSLTEKAYGDAYETWLANVLDIPGDKQVILYRGVPGVNSDQISGSIYRIKSEGAYRVTAGGWQVPDGVNMVNSDGSNVSLTETINSCLFSFTPGGGRGIRLDVDARDVQDWAVQASPGKVVGRSTYDDQKKVWALDVFGDKGWKTVLAIPQARYDLPRLMGLGRDGRALLLRRTDSQGFAKFSEIDADGHEAPLDLPDGNHFPIFSRATNALMGFKSNMSIETYTLYDPVLIKIVPLITAALPGCLNTFVDCAEDARKIVIYSEGADDSGSFYHFDFTTGDAEPVGAVHPDIPANWIAETRSISYKAADGLDIAAYMTVPKGDLKGRALVVLPHEDIQGYNLDDFNWQVQALASRGYIVLLPQFRGSGGRGQAFAAAGHGELGRKMQTDLSDGVQYLVGTGMVDPKRVAIAGMGFAGYSALAGVTLQKGIYNCAVSIAGISDLKAYFDYIRDRSGANSHSYELDYLHRYTGNTVDDISPIRSVATAEVPVLLMHGDADVIVPPDQSQRFYDAMMRAGHPVEFVKLEKEDHWLSREATRVQMLDSMVTFLGKHNPA